MFKISKATRKKTKIKLALAGPSGSGKTYSALKIARGLASSWDKIVVIDTENGSADLYSNLGEYSTLTFKPPYTPERYIEAMELCEKSGAEVIVLDSISHEWEGKGGILEIVDSMAGNSYTNWGKVTPRHNAFISRILQSPAHIVATLRSKQDYVLTEKNGKFIPEKVGLKAITREGVDYEFTLVFDLDIKHNATSSKDRTELFMDKPPFMIDETTGEKIKEWTERGEERSLEEPELPDFLNEDSEVPIQDYPNESISKAQALGHMHHVMRKQNIKNTDDAQISLAVAMGKPKMSMLTTKQIDSLREKIEKIGYDTLLKKLDKATF